MAKAGFDPILYIIARRDIEIPPGKLAAQAGHAVIDVWLVSTGEFGGKHNRADVCNAWRRNGGAKICVSVVNLETLCDLRVALEDAGIPVAVITDAARTVFTEPTVTCMGVGPLWRSEAELLKGLPLY